MAAPLKQGSNCSFIATGFSGLSGIRQTPAWSTMKNTMARTALHTPTLACSGSKGYVKVPTSTFDSEVTIMLNRIGTRASSSKLKTIARQSTNRLTAGVLTGPTV